jgi:hypothetical protein
LTIYREYGSIVTTDRERNQGRHQMVATNPLPAHHQRLRDGRYEVNIARPSTKRTGSWIVHTVGRFDLHNLDAALQWAAANTPDGYRFTVTSYSARDGWMPHRVPSGGAHVY